jgi:ribosomal protein S18 acetylase RimI-like enzyme
MYKFIEVSFDNELLIEKVFDILLESGQHMYDTEGLTHWLNPYSIDKIKESLIDKRIFLTMEGSRTIATFTLSDTKTKFFTDEENFIYLSKFAVKPTLSNKGLGSECLDFMEKLVKEQKFIGIRLDVYEKSIPAINFYKKKGFSITSTANTTNYKVLCMEKRV